MIHKPVLIKEVLEYLNPQKDENFIDCTVGEGGHTIEILERNGPNGKVLGIDWDLHQIENAREQLQEYKERSVLITDSYLNIGHIAEANQLKPIHGILVDLGYSSWHIEESGKGFSFMKDEPLDMRYSIENNLTAEKIINEYSESELEKILKEYGEEKNSRKIAKKIIEERTLRLRSGQGKIKTTFQLIDIIGSTIPLKSKSQKIHFATRTFQALRIAVNHELDNLIEFLPKAVETLVSGGRLVIISFHSLEDRIVKNYFKETSEEGTVKILTKKPVIANEIEMAINPRSRSAKLRAIIKL